MLSFAFYLLKVTICSGILFGYYWIGLRNKIFHRYNRFYLLAVIVLSLALPLVQISIWHDANQPVPQSIQLLQVINSSEYLDEIIITARQTNITTEQVMLFFYTITSLVFFIFFIQALIRIRSLFLRHQHSFIENICIVNTNAKGTPFSFLKYIFWNDHIDPGTPTGKQIFKHELAHVRQKHSYDKLFINVTLIFFWCNPFFWLMRKELNMIHEFMADKIAVDGNDTEAFAAMILQAAYPRYHFHLNNPFYYSPIKRRLMMLTKIRNPKAGYIGRLLVLPLTLLVFAAFTLKAKTFKQINPDYNGKTITVVIDAGHGGKDGGAINLQGTVMEKDLNLAITKKIKSLNTNDKIKIVLTRETDIFQTVQEKVAFTKAAGADLFISIHMGAYASNTSTTKSGMNVCVANNNSSNAGSSLVLASVLINEFNNKFGLPVAPQPQQSKINIRVLQDAMCPAVLIEAGYISNNKDLEYIETTPAKEIIARNILMALEKYAIANEKGGGIELPVQGTSALEIIAGNKTDTVPERKLTSIEKPLIIVDGKVQSSGFNFNIISPNDIESINILKDKNAVDKYGEKAIDGAIEIITKGRKDVKEITIFDAPKKHDLNEVVIVGWGDKKTGDQPDHKIFLSTEKPPTFPGGDSAWRRYLNKNLNGKVPHEEGWKSGVYKILVSFIVRKDGTIVDIKTNDYPGSKTSEHCIDLIRKGPRWEPAIQNGHLVNAYRKQPITFVVENK